MDNGLNIANIVSDTAKGLAKELSGVDNINGKKIAENIVVFVGLAGGTGTSTLVANVGYKLVRKGYSVLVIDTNIMYPTQHIFWGIKQELEKDDFVSYLSGEKNFGECIEYKEGTKVGILTSNNRNLYDFVGTDTEGSSKNFAELLDRASVLFDIVLIDCSSRVETEIVNTALYKCDKIYCVMDENIECLSNYERFKNNLQSTGINYNKLKVIMNKRTSIYYAENVFKSLEMDLISVIPMELAVIESGIGGKIFIKNGVSENKTAAVFVRCIAELANIIAKDGGELQDGITETA